MKTRITLTLLAIFFLQKGFAQLPKPGLVGYFHNWENADAPYINLNEIDDRYNIIEIAFAEPKVNSDSDMEFNPALQSQEEFISQMRELQNQGKKIIISIGGANGVVQLVDETTKNEFITSMNNIIDVYGFDGIDIDLESHSLRLSPGTTISNPTDAKIVNLIDAVKQIMANYQSTYNKKMLLTMAPEIAYVQGGSVTFVNEWGAYLPVIDEFRDEIDMLQVQLYNTGGLNGLDGNPYNAATGDFIVAMTEMLIQGFNTAGGQFNGIPANKIAIGLPSCPSAAPSGGYVEAVEAKNAINYLIGKGPKSGSYTLQNASGYPDLAGMMTWSINWDAASDCASAYEYAQNFENIFGTTNLGITDYYTENSTMLYPNPAKDMITIDLSGNTQRTSIQIVNMNGQTVKENQFETTNTASMDISNLSAGVYFVNTKSENKNANFTRLVKL